MSMKNGQIYADNVRMESPLKEAWMSDASCVGVDPNLFFPDRGGKPLESTLDICRNCPVRMMCLEKVMREEGSRFSDNRFGYFAGLGPRQRYRLYRKNAGLA